MKRHRRSAQDARAAILDVAERHLAEGGPAAVRVQRVAAELGLTDAAVHYHFGNREKLMTALLKSAGRKLKATFQEGPATIGEEDVVAAIIAQLDDTYRRKGYARLAMWLSLAGWRSEGTGVYRPMADRLHEARSKPAALDETLLAVAAMNVFMMGDALSGADMLAGVGLPADAETREQLRDFLAGLISERLRLGARLGGATKHRLRSQKASATARREKAMRRKEGMRAAGRA